MRWRTRTARGLAAVAACLLGSGCGIGAMSSAAPDDEDEVPFDLLDPDARPMVTTASPSDPAAPNVCLVGADGRLTLIPQQLPLPVRAADALDALEPDELPGDSPVRTAVPERGAVRLVDVAGGIAAVDLGGEVGTLPAGELQLVIAQVVCTLTGLPGIGQVSFTLEGLPAEVPTGRGALTSRPVSREDYVALLP